MDIFTLIFRLDFFLNLKVFRLWAKVSRTLIRKMSTSCQIYNLCVLRKILKILNFRKLLKAFSPIFLKLFRALRGNSFETIFYVSGGTIWIFFWNLQLVEIFRAWLEGSHTFGPEIQQVLKTANYVFRGSLTVLSLCWLDFSLFKIFVIFSEFFCISGQKN